MHNQFDSIKDTKITMSGRVRDDDPLQDFMNDVFKSARRAVRDAKRREKKEEDRRKKEERRLAEAHLAKMKRLKASGGVSKKAGSSATRPSSRDGGQAAEETPEGKGYEADPDAWKEDVEKLKRSLAAFDVSSDGLRVTWHAGAGSGGGSGISELASKSAGAASPLKLPHIGGGGKAKEARSAGSSVANEKVQLADQ